MKIMQGSGREDTHWGQCFEEFYGPEYCKNLRKDLEKLKDEFYDGNPQRFQKEWVLPTALLLRRMRLMGFPVRTREYVLIHLYNPVDSMSSGEMHFQVGRKIPGTLTLKFTKQNTGGAFVIQPKTLSGPDEVKLNEDPVRYFDEVRREMRESSVDSSVQLTTLVLMTDLCKLERKSLKEFLQSMSKNENRVPLPMSSAFPEVPPSCPPPTSVPFNSGHWAAMAVPNMFNPESLTRPDANFPFPWNFCVKNYVNYNGREGKPTTEVGVSMQNPNLGIAGASMHNPNIGIASASSFNTGQFAAVGNAFRQNRSSTWHSEPEENDETLNMLSMNEQQWDKRNRTPAQGVEEIQRRMSDSKLWDAPKPPSTATPEVVSSPESNRQEMRFPNRQPPATSTTTQAVATTYDVRTKITEDYAGEASGSSPSNSSPEIMVNNGLNCNLPSRRDSETRTSLTDQYLTGTSPSTNYNSYGLCCPPPGGDTSPSPLSFPNERRTSHTEAYAGESPPNGSGSGKNPFSGAFTEAMDAARHSRLTSGGHLETRGRSSPRATSVEDYTGNEPIPNTRQHLPSSSDAGAFRQRAFSGASQLTVPAQPLSANCPLSMPDDCNDKARTSSLDAYVGDPTQNPAQRVSGSIGKFHSTGDLNRPDRQPWPTAPATGRTTAVDEYLGESNGSGEEPAAQPAYIQRPDQPRQSVHFRSPAASYSGSSSYGSDVTNGYDSNEGYDATSNTFESWGSHCPSQPPPGGPAFGQQQWRPPTAGGRFNGGGGPRVPELSDENEMSLLSHTSFPSWGSHRCGANAGSNFNRIMIPLTVEEYNKNLLQDGGGGGSGLAGSGWQQYLPSDS